MKRILIVVPGCRTGGVLSSLLALLNSSFVERYCVHLFIMNTYADDLSPELKKYSIGKNAGTSLLVANIKNYVGFRKLILVLAKVLFHIPILGKLISSFIENVTIRILERKQYDCVISFKTRNVFQLKPS